MSATGVLLPTREPPRDPSAKTASFRPDIEGLRAVAVGLVVLFHAGLPLVPGGFIGVDVFFVLSGFLITGLLIDEVQRSGTISLSNFYARRARRLLPMSTLVLVFTCVVGAILIAPLDLNAVGADVRSAALFVSNWHFAASATDYWAPDTQSPVLHFWSLSVEEQFYFVWPLVILGVVRFSRKRAHAHGTLLRNLGITLAAIGLTSFALSVVTTSTSGAWAYFGTQTRAWELAVGGGLALARPLLPRIPRAPGVILGWAGLAAVLIAACFFSEATPFPGSAAALPVLGTAAVIAAGARGAAGGAPRLMSERPLRFVGHISYAWYLWHWPCLIFLALLPGIRDSGPTAWQTTAAVVVSFGLSVATNRIIEDPVRRSAWLSASKARSLSVGAGLVGLALVASLLLSTGKSAETYSPSGAQLSGSLAQLVDLGGVKPMTAAQARNDKKANIQNCHGDWQTVKPDGVCLFGDPTGTTSVALIGDSHALHWFPAFDQYAKAEKVRLYFFSKSQCPFSDVSFHTDGFEGLYTSCTAWQQEVIKRLETLPKLKQLFVMRSSRYTNILLTPDYHRIPQADVESTWRTGVEHAIKDLAPLAPRVVLFEDTPKSPTDVPACLSQLHNAARCSFDPVGNVHPDAVLVKAETDAIKPYSNVEQMDLTDVVCPGSPCPVVTKGGVIVYRDAEHLTVTFTKSMWRILQERLKP